MLASNYSGDDNADDYRECAASLDNLGFNSALLDIEIPRVDEKELPNSEQAKVAEIVVNKSSETF